MLGGEAVTLVVGETGFFGDGIAQHVHVVEQIGELVSLDHVRVGAQPERPFALGAVVGLLGIAIAYRIWVQKPGTSAAIQARLSPLHKLFSNKWYFDELIDILVVRPFAWFGRFGQQTFERIFVTGTLVGGTTGIVRAGSAAVRAVQSGYLRSYAAFLLVGLALVAFYFLLQA